MRCPVCEAPRVDFFSTVSACDYWRCTDCRATFLEPAQRPAVDAERARYRLHRNDPADAGYRRFLSRLADPLLERLAPGRCGLDYGCGPGPVLAAMFREAGHQVALYDPYFHDDRSALGARYDFITCSEVAEHFHRPAEEFRRLGGMLKPGGWLAVMTCFQADDARFANWHYRRDPTHVVFYREHTFHRLAQIHGWDCEIPSANVALLHSPDAADEPA